MKTIRDLLRRAESAEGPELPAEHERCLSCQADLEGSRSYQQLRVCHSCGFHFHLSARERLATLLDAGSFHEDDRGVTALDPLSFQSKQSYRSRVISAQRRTGLAEAALTGTGAILGREVVLAVLDFSFLGGSIGVAAGERLARAFEKAADRRAPLISICSTSGTRMQEGLLALMQLPRVVAAARRHHRAGLAHIAVLTDPTTGSAYTGFVNLADFVVAEPNALLGYAAMRVLQEHAGAEMPGDAHTSEWHLKHGLVDAVVARPQLRDFVASVLDLLLNDYHLSASKPQRATPASHSDRVAWQQVQLSRHRLRPTAIDLIGHMTTSFIEIRGDRAGADDPAVVAGIGSLGGEPVVVIGQVRPHDGDKKSGLIRAAGFRKARRAMSLGGKFGLPIVTLIDTAGADPSLEGEMEGLGQAVAECMAAMLEAPSPTIAVIIGEGNSEGAVAMAVADRVLMLDNAVYEVIRPEDAAAILFQEADRAGEAAERLRITSHDCMRLGIVDATVSEPGEGAHTDHAETARLLRRSILRNLVPLRRLRTKKLLDRRYSRYREIGSTHSWIRGTLERRMAHFTDRFAGAVSRIRNRSSLVRRRTDYGEESDIPV